MTGYTYRWNDAQTDATLVPIGNCAQCHRPGIAGVGAFELLANVGAFDARASSPLSLTGIVVGPLSFPLTDPAHRVLVPGAPAFSQLLAR